MTTEVRLMQDEKTSPVIPNPNPNPNPKSSPSPSASASPPAPPGGPPVAQDLSNAPHGWIASGVPFRPADGTYSLFLAGAHPLPPLSLDDWPELRDRLTKLKTLDDVRAAKSWLHEVASSPTACYVSVEHKTHRFYVDQQGCVVWRYQPSIGVYVDGRDAPFVVAPTLAEFFLRLHVESKIIHASYAFSGDAKIYAAGHGGGPRFGKMFPALDKKDAPYVWEKLAPRLTMPERTYLARLYKHRIGQEPPGIREDDIREDDVREDDVREDDVRKDDVREDDVRKDDVREDDVRKDDVRTR